MRKIKVLVTAVGAEPGRNVIRALAGKEDIEVIATNDDPLIPVLYNKEETSASYLLPRAKNEKKYLEKLTEVVEKEKVSVILPCIEDEVFVLSKNRALFEKKGVRIVCPEFERVIRLTDKKNMTDLSRRAKIPTPTTCLLGDYAGRAAKIGFPLIVKPRIGHGAKKVTIVKNKKDMKKISSQLSKHAGEFIVQSYIKGEVGSIFLCGMLYGRDGRIITEFVSRSLKTLFPFGGTAMCGEPVKGFDRLKTYSKNLIKLAGGWYGPVNIEYKISSEDGIPYILEVNPRFWGYGLLAVKSGIDFPYIAVMEALGRYRGSKVLDVYRDDVILLRELVDTVIPKAFLKKTHSDKKSICIYELTSSGKMVEGNVARLLSMDDLDKVILTGKDKFLKPFARKVRNEERLSSYVRQAKSARKNLYEIGFYNFADVVIMARDSEKGLGLKKIGFEALKEQAGGM